MTQPLFLLTLSGEFLWFQLSHIINTRLSKKVIKCEAEIVEVRKERIGRASTAYIPVILLKNDGNECKIYDNGINGSGNPDKYKIGQRVEVGFNSEKNQFVICSDHKDIFVTVFLLIPNVLIIYATVSTLLYFFGI